MLSAAYKRRQSMHVVEVRDDAQSEGGVAVLAPSGCVSSRDATHARLLAAAALQQGSRM